MLSYKCLLVTLLELLGLLELLHMAREMNDLYQPVLCVDLYILMVHISKTMTGIVCGNLQLASLWVVWFSTLWFEMQTCCRNSIVETVL